MLHVRLGGCGAPANLLFSSSDGISSQKLTPKIVCMKQYEQLFPFHVCHMIRDKMNLDLSPVKNIFKNIKNSFSKFFSNDEILNENLGLRKDSKHVKKISELFSDLKMVVDHCWLFRDENKKNFFIQNEREIMEWMNHKSFKENNYLEIIYHVFHYDEGKILLYRNYNLDRTIRDLSETFLSWNAWYSPLSNTLFIPSGFVHFALKKLNSEECIFQSFVSTFITHEISHLIWNQLETQWKIEKELNKDNKDDVHSLYQWNNIMKEMAMFWKIERDSKKFSELFADWLGDPIAYRSLFLDSDEISLNLGHLNGKPKQIHEKKCFFSTIFRLWCRDKCMKDHPCDRVRALISIQSTSLMKRYFEDIYKCKNSGLIVFTKGK